MATKVEVTYTPSQNVSVTHRDGVLSKVTLWTSGAEGKDTVRIV
jgi:hypothetical protein